MILTTLNIILLSTLLVCLIIQLVYWWVVLAKPYFLQKAEKKQTTEENIINPRPVSVIIYTQDDDAELLETNLTAMLEQDYPKYEVIVIDDNLSSESSDLLKQLRTKYRNFYFTHIPDGTRNLSRKKLGLTLGIKAAQYDNLLFTESDSRPVSNQWIKSMASSFSDKKSIVLGFVTMAKKKGLGTKYAAFDYFFTNLQILSAALRNKSYGANGKNMGYEKHYFNDRKGFSKFRFLESGADDLFFNEIAQKDSVAVNVSPDALIETSWEDNDYGWKRWKISRSLTKQYYDSKELAFWRIESFSRTLFLGLVIFLIITEFFSIFVPIIAFGAYLIRLISQILVLKKTTKNLSIPSYWPLLPIFDIVQIFYDVYFYFYSMIKGKEGYTWRLGS
ncbi:glycosyltransferase [Bacteroidales bacterium OttesenSCG-928-M11]|nr:glycosyltransferase [Bacteroidales bacterium OttesenSCG-928-M11]